MAQPDRQIRIVHVITGLPVGGAQSQILALIRTLDPAAFPASVISLTKAGAMAPAITEAGATVTALGLSRRAPNPLGLWRLSKMLRAAGADVVQTWLYHGDLIGGFAARMAGVPVVWNIRHSDLRKGGNRASTIWTARASAHLSRRIPRAIVCNSRAAADVHAAMGYDRNRMQIIPNGIDVARFAPDEEAGASLRSELGADPGVRLVGLFGRDNPQKDHRTFIAAAARVATGRPDVAFVLCGEGIERTNAQLWAAITASGAGEKFHLLGLRDDMPRLTAALDLCVSSSAFGESFSNVLAEAMACGVPCVATESGGARDILGDNGWVVAAAAPEALAGAMLEALGESREQHQDRGRAARARIVDKFAIEAVAETYAGLYRAVAGGGDS